MANELSFEQKETVKTWINEGMKLVEVQKLLNEKFGINLTYMEVRFLVDDLDLTMPDPKPAETSPAKGDVGAAQADSAQPEQPSQGVLVEVNPVQRPGVLTGGTVRFSDGVQATWELDAEGRLQLGGIADDYRPSQDDVMDFQQKLRTILSGSM